MKKSIFYIISVILAVFTGCQKYEFNTDFTMPDELVSPSTVKLDVTSSSNVTLLWNGGGAADGGILLYNVIFDKEGGDFTNPVAVLPSDLGAGRQLSMTHAQLNTIARKAGIKPNEAGKLIWTITASKGGITKHFDGYSSLSIVRGDGIDNIPEHLFIKGSAALEAGQEFRVVSEGLYVIYTELSNGKIFLTSEQNGGFNFYADSNGKLNEGEGQYELSEAPTTGLARVTVNFNTLSFTIEEVAKEVRAIWGANYADIAILEYAGNGNFVGDGDVIFLGPGRDGTPDWCSWVEERYYFIAVVNGTEVCWGSTFGSGAWTPDGTEEFFDVVENPWDQWSNLWKMDHAYDMCHVTFTINTNKDNRMTHSYSGGAISYEQPTSTPAELYINGSAVEAQGQKMTKVGDKFVICNKLKDGNISFADENGTKYFIKDENDLYVGSPKTSVSASEGVTRITVDFSAKKISYDRIDTQIFLKWAATYYDVITLEYQGLGKYAGEGDILFLGPGVEGTPDWCSWVEERYYFIVKVNGEDKCWGSLDGITDQRPDGDVAANYYNIGEYAWEQWSHCWKMASEFDNSTASVSINTADMTHSFVKLSSDPVPPTVAPSELNITGDGVEADAQFRKVSDGVFEVITKLSDGKMSFTSGNKKYFADAEGKLWQGDGSTSVSTGTGLAQRVVVDFVNCEVKVQEISYLKAIWCCNNVEFMKFSYSGNGKFSASAAVTFIQPGDPINGLATWLTWVEERYRFIVTIDGADYCWGSLAGISDQRPNSGTNASYWNMKEYPVGGQWDNPWKFADDIDGSTAEVVIVTNDNGVMTHSVTKK